MADAEDKCLNEELIHEDKGTASQHEDEYKEFSFEKRLPPRGSSLYRRCGVPMCKSRVPKIFFCVPKNKDLKNAWLRAANRDIETCPTSEYARIFFCQDHFNLEEDTCNFMRWKMQGNIKLTLRKDAVPSIFACQEVATVKENLQAFKQHSQVDKDLDHAYCLEPSQDLMAAPVSGPEASESAETSESAGEASTGTDIPENKGVATQLNLAPGIKVFSNNFSTALLLLKKLCINKSTQVNLKPHYRSRQSQTIPINEMTYASSFCEKRKLETDCACPAFVKLAKLESSSEVPEESPSSPTSKYYHELDEFVQQITLKASLSPGHGDENVAFEEIRDAIKTRKESTIALSNNFPNHYLGLPKDAYFLIKMLETRIPTKLINILIVLKKMRFDHPFASLGHDFNLDSITVSRIFRNTIKLMAKHLSALVFLPDGLQIRKSLPLAFRGRYDKTFSIIDCLEMEIEKPSDKVHHSMTWSECKMANTIKYLISSTPSGFVTFISKSYGGRATDEQIVQDSGYLATLPWGGVVMADCGFKNIVAQLRSNNCLLVRVPSVSEGLNMTEEETQRNISLRKQIEQVMRRLKEFKILNSVLDHDLLSLADHTVIVACALINCS